MKAFILPREMSQKGKSLSETGTTAQGRAEPGRLTLHFGNHSSSSLTSRSAAKASSDVSSTSVSPSPVFSFLLCGFVGALHILVKCWDRLRCTAACSRAYARTPSAASRSSSDHTVLRSSHQAAFHSSVTVIRRISSLSNKTSSVQRC